MRPRNAVWLGFAVCVFLAPALEARSSPRIVRVGAGDEAKEYPLQQELGPGGSTSSVHIGVDVHGRPFIAKILRPERAREGLRDTFDLEDRILGEMEADGAPFTRSLGIGHTSDAPAARALVMAYDPSLQRVSAKALKGPGQAVRVALRVLDGAIAMERRGFSHNDLRTHNVLIDPRRGSSSTTIIDVGNATPARERIGEDAKRTSQLLLGLLADVPVEDVETKHGRGFAGVLAEVKKRALRDSDFGRLTDVLEKANAGGYTLTEFQAALRPFGKLPDRR